ncbi:MAG: hypothetical protein F6J93_12025 [Oscillatoria sp. SIO1A7]|nr:hypothetical protein [Oscillatoria sp. SIO1A7]
MEKVCPRVSPHPTPYTPHPTPYTPQPTPHTLHPTPYTPHPIRSPDSFPRPAANFQAG